jgi:SAM-dependent methyltransferase
VTATRLRGARLLEGILAVPARDRDAWVDGQLGFPPPPPDVADLPRGAVPYLPCGVEEIVELVREVPLGEDDHFVDLGSGVGRAAILAHLLSGATASGVEIQEPLVARARQRCAELELTAVSFVCANAADVTDDALDGSVFFLYAPFNGALLTAVLARLEAVARKRSRPIVVCTVDLELHDVPWLVRRPRGTSRALAVYDARLSSDGTPPSSASAP